MPPIPNNNKRLSDWLAAEADQPPFYCREEIEVVGGELARTGAVLGKTNGGEYAVWDPAASDGSNTAAGILVTDYVSGETAGPQPAVAIVRGPATVKEAGVTWPDGVSEIQKQAARDALSDLGIVFRQSA